MFNFIRKKMNKKGFTLVELLVVIAVLGIIAGIAIPRMGGVTTTFKTKADVETAKNIARQVQVRIQIGAIPLPADKAKVIITTGSEAADGDTKGEKWFGEEFTANPANNTTGHFVIEVTNEKINIYVSADQDVLPTTASATEGEAAIAVAAIHTMDHGGAIK